jgi:hypothetical protein
VQGRWRDVDMAGIELLVLDVLSWLPPHGRSRRRWPSFRTILGVLS